jgi:type I restriction enzyme R subunit
MLGRATRTCKEINKDTFRIYDAVRLYETLEDYTQMKPVVADPKTSFKQLAEELPLIQTNERAKKQLDQIIAKLQRKKRKMNDQQEELFKYNSGGKTADDFIHELQQQPLQLSIDEIIQRSGLWKFLDELKPQPVAQYFSDHADEYRGTERGYGRGQKPEDYLQSFEKFIKEKQNEITALRIVCTNPKELDRKSLKKLYLELSQAGFDQKSLNLAWKEAKNQEIAADIVSFIRTLAINAELISHEERIKRAVDKVRTMQAWSRIQLNWLDRFEKQLIAETVLHRDDLDAEPFREHGGFTRLNKVFDEQLETIIDTINDNLYTQTA